MRPRCAWCGELLRPHVTETRGPEGWQSPVVRRVWTGWQGYPYRDPIFHALRCAEAFAVRMYQAGMRRYTDEATK